MSPPVARDREAFERLVEGVRPELHRYCARLTGSVIEGEDIVQETLTRAFHALDAMGALPELRPWLFRVAHNAAVDHLKRHGRARTELHDDITVAADRLAEEQPPDPAVVRAALARFLLLPVLQRSAVILKDVLGHSLEETAEAMETTVMAVKAALVRGRARLRDLADEERMFEQGEREKLQRYAERFNARDWSALRALIHDDCQLDLVSKVKQRGAEVRQYFGRYAERQVSLEVVLLEGLPALAAYEGGALAPSYFILLGWEGEQVSEIRDFRYVPYIALEAEFVSL